MPSASFIARAKESGSDTNPDKQLSIRQLPCRPALKAKFYYELANLNAKYIKEPTAITGGNDSMLQDTCCSPWNSLHLCHNQSTERHVKLVTEALFTIMGFELRNGIISQKINR